MLWTLQSWQLLISINYISLTKEMNPITRNNMSNLVRQPNFRAVGQTHAEKQSVRPSLTYCSTSLSNVRVFRMSVLFRVFAGPTALKLGCITNFDLLFLVIGFTSSVDKIKFILISSRIRLTENIFIDRQDISVYPGARFNLEN